MIEIIAQVFLKRLTDGALTMLGGKLFQWLARICMLEG